MIPPPRPLLRPDRLRTIERPFAWLPCRLLTGGLLSQMSRPAKLLYLMLALAADRRGISFYGDRRIQNLLGLASADLQQARADLISLDLLAFDGQTFQLLSLPSDRPTAAPATTPLPQPAAACGPSRHEPTAEIPAEARRVLRRILGRDFNG